MFEVELKAWLKRPEAVEEKLLDMGAVFVGAFTYRDLYLSHATLKVPGEDEELRIREVGDEGYLTLKGKALDKEKTKEELEVKVYDPGTLVEIFKKLGFNVYAEKVKHVRLYDLEGIRVAIVKVEKLGDFIEVELMVEKQDEVEKAKKRLYNLLDRLGIGRENIEFRYYLELLAQRQHPSR